MRQLRRAGVNRREFLIQSGLAAGAVAGGLVGSGCANQPPATTQSAGNGVYRGVHLALDGKDPAVASKPAQWAISQLERALTARNIRVVKSDSSEGMKSAAAADFHITVIRTPNSGNAGPEGVAFGTEANGAGLAVTGSGERGLVYALSEVADVINLSPDPLAALPNFKPQSEGPANKVRSVMRMFCTDVEDKQWFNDRTFWRSYLDMLAAQRFNRFHLALGLGYDAPSGLIDTYFYFPYPFLFAVPGYDVRATNLPNAERDKNLEMIRFISDETAARGMHFQMGLWTHAYKWVNSPRANHVIEGLTDDKHAPYCRDALALLLKECPNISGVTFRIHGESGVPEGSYDLWKTIFEGCTKVDRRIEIDMHAKGMDQKMIDTALSVGLPVTISPKYWAEHMGLPYHQAAIRPSELPVPGRRGSGAMALSAGERSFTRYGYGDLLAEDRKFGIIHRMWPGTQRVLFWGDPLFASAFSRSSSFCGSLGCELMEPTSFKGRKGSGLPGGRDGYAAPSLRAPGGDFEKYRYYYRVWGRMLYNPATDASVFDRWLSHEYGAGAAPAVKEAIATSGRILPLFTTAHTPAAANNNYWPEMYVNQSIVNGARREPYTETPVPSRFGMVSPLDPQMFARIEDYAQMLLDGKSSGKYSAAEVAQALEELANTASKHLSNARAKAGETIKSAAFRRMAIDVNVAAGLGRFFAHKIRASALWAIYDRGGHSRDALDAAIKEYRAARDAWGEIVELTRGIYANDVSYGIGWYQRGHWSDRLPAIEQDLAAMEALVSEATQQPTPPHILQAISRVPQRTKFGVEHLASPTFKRGMEISLTLKAADGKIPITAAQCFYRRTHQAESWTAIPMRRSSEGWTCAIPTAATSSSYPVQYYFELSGSGGEPSLFPGFNSSWSNQPYFVTRPA